MRPPVPNPCTDEWQILSCQGTTTMLSHSCEIHKNSNTEGYYRFFPFPFTWWILLSIQQYTHMVQLIRELTDVNSTVTKLLCTYTRNKSMSSSCLSTLSWLASVALLKLLHSFGAMQSLHLSLEERYSWGY